MRVLFVHNYYRSGTPSGENQAVDEDALMLTDRGIEVSMLTRRSDELVGTSYPSGARLLEAALGPVWSTSSADALSQVLSLSRPDIVHIHNVFPLLGPAVVKVAMDAGVPIVHTVHNYRHTCMNGLHFRDGHVCLDCESRRSGWPGVVHACYQNSRPKSMPMFLSSALHAARWRQLNAYITLTPYMKTHLIEAGFPPERIHLRPTPVRSSTEAIIDPPGTGRVLYLGRLEEAKGVRLLLDAASQLKSGRLVAFAGSGALQQEVQRAAATGGNVSYLGNLSLRAVEQALDQSDVLAVPSLCLEGFPRVVSQAFSRGRAVMTVDGGSVASIVTAEVGWTCPPDATSLAKAIDAMSSIEVVRRGASARRRFERDCSPEVAFPRLVSIYRLAQSGVSRVDPA